MTECPVCGEQCADDVDLEAHALDCQPPVRAETDVCPAGTLGCSAAHTGLDEPCEPF